MYLKRLLVVFLPLCIVIPLLTHAATLAELQAQLQVLQVRLTALQMQLPQPPQAVAAACSLDNPRDLRPNLSRNLSRGSRGEDVRQLQQFLISQNLLASDSATGFFGLLTERVVQQWQSKNGIVSSGEPTTTGYGAVGPRTRAAVARVCSGRSATATSGQASSGMTHTGTNQGGTTNPTNFSASPHSGTAPLRVLFRAGVEWSSAYSINFGDGQSAPLQNNCPGGSIGACGQPTAEHTYATVGTYTAQLIQSDPGGCGAITDSRCLGAPPSRQILGSIAITASAAGGGGIPPPPPPPPPPPIPPPPPPPQPKPIDQVLACGITESRLQQIHSLLDSALDSPGPEHLIDSASDAANYPQVIYDLQGITANVLQAGENCEDIYILDKLATLYAIPFFLLKADASGNMIWPDGSGHEVVLDSTQFMYAVAKLINVIVHIDRARWTPGMYDFVHSIPNGPRQYLIAHLNRWMDHKTMWTWPQCGYATSDPLREYAFPEYVARKSTRTLGYASAAPTYCNALQEPELWVAAAATELISADQASHYWIGLDLGLKSQLTTYARDAVHLMESRITSTAACSDGSCVGGLLDSGAWHGHPEYPAEYWKNGGEIFDFSHMSRIVPWFDTFYRHTDITLPAYTLDGIMKLFANQLAYKVFNGNNTDPAFANFWNGSNVAYPRTNITYGPYELSSDYFRSGYGFWASFRGDIGNINAAITNILDNRTATSYLTPGGSPPGGVFDLLGFYSSLTHPVAR